MGLIGKTTIKLFDAKTGELSDMVESSNMVTNAVSNIFGGGLNALIVSDIYDLASGDNLGNIFDIPDGYNFAKTFFGGVLVFSRPIEEDVNHIIPTADEIKSFIGCGNQGSSITKNKFKGNFNENESVIGDNYVTFVWDFSTEQCNGDVASICLTSDVGGNLGYAFGALDAKYQGVLNCLRGDMWKSTNPASYSSAHYPLMKSSYTNANAHASFVSGHNYYYVYEDKVYRHDIAKLLRYPGVGILDGDGYTRVSNYDEVITLDNYSYNIFTTADEDKVYEMDGHQSSASALTLLKVHYAGGVKVETVNIPTENILTSLFSYHKKSEISQVLPRFSNNAIIYNDKIYFLTGRVNSSDLVDDPNKLRMYVLSFNGSFSYKDIDCTSTVISMLFGDRIAGGSPSENMGVKFIKMFDSLFLVSTDSTNGYKYFMVSDDGSISDYPVTVCKSNLAYYGVGLRKNSLWLKEPWCSFKFVENGAFNSTELWNTYLATINNQGTVLTKTEAKTMKIIYTLTQS